MRYLSYLLIGITLLLQSCMLHDQTPLIMSDSRDISNTDLKPPYAYLTIDSKGNSKNHFALFMEYTTLNRWINHRYLDLLQYQSREIRHYARQQKNQADYKETRRSLAFYQPLPNKVQFEQTFYNDQTLWNQNYPQTELYHEVTEALERSFYALNPLTTDSIPLPANHDLIFLVSHENVRITPELLHIRLKPNNHYRLEYRSNTITNSELKKYRTHPVGTLNLYQVESNQELLIATTEMNHSRYHLIDPALTINPNSYHLISEFYQTLLYRHLIKQH